MIESRQYQIGDAYQVIPREDAFGDDETLALRTDELGKVNKLCWTIEDSGEIIGIVGGLLMWPGVMEVYTMLSEKVKNHPIQFHKEVEIILDELIKELKLWRVQMTVREDFPQGQRWAESLGFFREGFLESYGADRSNYFMYVRLEDVVG